MTSYPVEEQLLRPLRLLYGANVPALFYGLCHRLLGSPLQCESCPCAPWGGGLGEALLGLAWSRTYVDFLRSSGAPAVVYVQEPGERGAC